MSSTSGIGFWYGHRDSNTAVLEDLLKDQDYDWNITREELDAGEYSTPESVVARLPTVLAENHWFHNPWVGGDGRLID